MQELASYWLEGAPLDFRSSTAMLCDFTTISKQVKAIAFVLFCIVEALLLLVVYLYRCTTDSNREQKNMFLFDMVCTTMHVCFWVCMHVCVCVHVSLHVFACVCVCVCVGM